MRTKWRIGSKVRVSVATGVFALAMLLLTTAGLTITCLAQSAGEGGANSRAARLSSVDGQVQVVVDGQVIADPAYANLPLFEGSQVVTRSDGRAEIATDDGNIVRVTPNSTITLTALAGTTGNTRTEVVVNAGQVYFELQPNSDSRQVRIDFGSTSVVPNLFSVVRVNFDTEPGVMAVFSGQVHVTRGNSLTVDAHGGQTLSLDPGDPSAYNLADTVQQDSWDQWNTDRDNALQAEESAKTPATAQMSGDEAAGMSDLDSNGNWYDVPGQGYVWSPYDAQGAGENWDPYGYGNWTSYPGVGYVWVSGYNWGYAPFNYGQWNYYAGFGWGWNPRGGHDPWWRNRHWMANVGNGPGGYLPPMRPRGRVETAQLQHGAASGHPMPLRKPILVDRRPSSGVNAYLGFHPGQPMLVGNHIVSPVRTIAPRTSYMRSYTYLSDRTPNSVKQGIDGGRLAYTPGGARYSRAAPTNAGRPTTGHGSYYGGMHGGAMHSGGASHGSSGGHR